MIRSNNAGGHIAHIGGAIFGLSYILVMRKGMNFSGVFNLRWIKGTFGKKRSRMKVEYTSGRNEGKRPLTDDEYNLLKAERQKKIDSILDKISKSGYESLTTEEKDLLFRSSNSNS
jgi:hypothetical protein